jgi:hypothetical protein
MFKATRYLPALFATTVLFTTPACAAGVYSQRFPVADRDDRAFYNRGLNEGRAIGIEDGRRGRNFDARAHREYRDIDRNHADLDDVRAYRQGFEAGYDEGYRQAARRDYPPRPNQPQYYPPPPAQPPTYGDAARDRYVSPGGQNGYRDGVEEGQRDARNGERFDPVRSRRYRSADHDYNRRFGSLDEYKREYRDAFQRGYETGYRGFRR